MALRPGGFLLGEQFDPNECEDTIYGLYKSLSSLKQNELSYSDLMFLTGHSRCCGGRLKREMISKGVI